MNVLRFVGDLSSMDAQVLWEFAEQSSDILEFGTGGSTQIFAKSGYIYDHGDADLSVLSVETNPAWIDKTERRISLMKDTRKTQFVLWEQWDYTGNYDLIFNDGVDGYRKEFGLKSFPLLRPGGYYLFHDQRRKGDIQNMIAVIEEYSAYIENVRINYRGSNLTVIAKRTTPLFYEDWNLTEQREEWQIGSADLTNEQLKWLTE